MKRSLYEAVAFLYFYTTNGKIEKSACKCRDLIELFYGEVGSFAGEYQNLRDEGYPFSEGYTRLEAIQYTIKLVMSYLEYCTEEEKSLIFAIVHQLTRTYSILYATT